MQGLTRPGLTGKLILANRPIEQMANKIRSMLQRVDSVDALRAFALFGIAVVNMPFLAAPFGQLPVTGPLDPAFGFAIALLFVGKFFLIFAFLFGWGIGVQQSSAARAGTRFTAHFFRRQAALFAIGVMHAIFVFVGDILVTYSLVGLLLFAVRSRSPSTLVRLAGWSLLLAVLIGDDASTVPIGPSGYLGDFGASVGQRISDIGLAFPFILMFNGPMVFAAFCCGLAAAHSDFLSVNHPLFARLSKHRWFLLTGGILANAPFALVSGGGVTEPVWSIFGFASLAVAAPLLSVAYLVFVIGWATRSGASGWTSAGRMSLTAYVAEGVLAGIVFNGYGLGLFGTLGSAVVTAIAIGIFLAVEICCTIWQRYLGQGPLERMLRWMSKAN
jgi:uncharacterized protein